MNCHCSKHAKFQAFCRVSVQCWIQWKVSCLVVSSHFFSSLSLFAAARLNTIYLELELQEKNRVFVVVFDFCQSKNNNWPKWRKTEHFSVILHSDNIWLSCEIPVKVQPFPCIFLTVQPFACHQPLTITDSHSNQNMDVHR